MKPLCCSFSSVAQHHFFWRRVKLRLFKPPCTTARTSVTASWFPTVSPDLKALCRNHMLENILPVKQMLLWQKKDPLRLLYISVFTNLRLLEWAKPQSHVFPILDCFLTSVICGQSFYGAIATLRLWIKSINDFNMFLRERNLIRDCVRQRVWRPLNRLITPR